MKSSGRLKPLLRSLDELYGRMPMPCCFVSAGLALGYGNAAFESLLKGAWGLALSEVEGDLFSRRLPLPPALIEAVAWVVQERRPRILKRLSWGFGAPWEIHCLPILSSAACEGVTLWFCVEAVEIPGTRPVDGSRLATMEALLALIPEGILLIDRETGVSALNPAGIKLLGLPAATPSLSFEALRQRLTLKALGAGNIPADPFLAAYEGKGFESALYQVERLGDRPRLVHLSAMPLLSPRIPQEPPSRVLLLAREVESPGELPKSDRLRQSQLSRALNDKIHQLAAIVGQINDAVLVATPKGDLLLVNEAARRILRLGPDANLSALEGFEIQTLDGQPIAREEMPLTRVLRGEGVRQILIKICDAAGERVLATSGTPILGDDGQVLMGVLVFHDMTEEYHLREALTKKVAELESALACLKEVDRLKMDFLNAVSHELRTPLTTIIGYSEFLQDEIAGELGPEQTSFVCYITESAQRLLAMINDLLDYARLAAGRLPLYVTPINPSELLEELLPTWSLRARAKQVSLSIEQSVDLPLVKADQSRLVQVLFNLVDNACKFTQAKGRVLIRLTHPEPDWVQWEIIDTGMGIPAAALPQLFTTFYQVDSGLRRTQGGTGLGLAISKLLIEAQGGAIGLDSIQGRGTRAWFKLPVWQASDREPEEH